MTDTPPPVRVLHIEDNRRDAELIRDLLDAHGPPCDVTHASGRESFERAVAEDPFDLIICDFNLPDLDGLSALRHAQQRLPAVPVIIVSGAIDPGEAVECLKAGATDYLLKDRLERLPSAVARALDQADQRRQRDAMEAQVRASEAFSRAILNSLADHISVLDRDGTIVAVNDAWIRFARANGGDACVMSPVGTNYLAVIATSMRSDEPTAAEANAGIRAVLDGVRETFVLEYPCHAPDRERWFVMTVSASRDESGGAVIAHHDITARRELTQELQRAQRLEAVGRLAAGVAHEINTPVQFVSDSVHFVKDAVADLLMVLAHHQGVRQSVLAGTPAHAAADEAGAAEEDVDLAYLVEKVPASLDRALDGLGRIATIVRSMKEFTHPGQREMSPVDLNQVIGNALAMATHEYKLVADVETDLGEIPPVTCHASDVSQVVLILIVNAAQAVGAVVADTGAKGRIAVRTRRACDDVLIEVADNGSGIPYDVRGHVFDPFFTTKDVGKGTGQGLAIARTIVVNRHGGTLTFDTAIGSGTTFIVRLPVRGREQRR